MIETRSGLVALFVVASVVSVGLSDCARTVSNSPSGSTQAPSPSAWKQPRWEELGDIDYLLPSKLPTGWKLKLATERPGRPRGEWQDHWEILTTAAQDRYLILIVHLLGAADSSQPSPSGKPGPVTDVSRDDFVPSIAYTTQREATAADHNTLHARGVEWQNARFAFRVAELASTPDDMLIQHAANELGGVKDLNFTVPNAILQEGFHVAGRAAGFPSDVTDYTVVWTPADLAGSSRSEAGRLPDTGATIFINIGCRFYGQGMRSLSSDPATAPVTSANGILDLQFLMDGSWVRVNGRGVDEQAVRSFAASLEPFSRTDWRARLGDRLLVDTSSQSAN